MGVYLPAAAQPGSLLPTALGRQGAPGVPHPQPVQARLPVGPAEVTREHDIREAEPRVALLLPDEHHRQGASPTTHLPVMSLFHTGYESLDKRFTHATVRVNIDPI